ncbi:MAG: DEAD/DEAH box helicase, partial [Candidatus Omnitrophica bacterium]|nr:DEAD/DEAH box helicase [Candidatus Omnitrophota bacterium]
MQESNLNFYGLGITPQLIDIILSLKFKNATPIQHQTIPIALEGKDIIGIAQTGTGKTMAFAIPMVQRLVNQKGRALVLVPTRELALQVETNILKLCHPLGIKTVSMIGGDPLIRQIRALERNPRILIATPGRLIDLMEQRKVRLNDVHILVLDEADRMLDMGFAPQINEILKSVPSQRQTMLFSATMPTSIVKITSSYMKFPVQVEIAPSGTASAGVTHELFIVRREQKRDLLRKLLDQYRGSVLLFSRTKIGASKIARAIHQMGHSASEIHSDRSLSQRKEALL